MARLFTDGFELGAQLGVPTYVTIPGTWLNTTARTGTYCYRANGASQAIRVDLIGKGHSFTVGTTTQYLRVYVAFDALPVGTSSQVAGFGYVSSSSLAERIFVAINPDGSLSLYNGATLLSSTGAGFVSADGSYHRLEISQFIGTGSVDTAEVRWDGTTILSGSSLAIAEGYSNTTATNNTGGVYFGTSVVTTTPTTWPTIRYDDIAVNDSSGSNQTSWPGDGKVINLVPISDQARDAKWTGGGSTPSTTNLWDAVDNEPPTATVSASATNTSQIEHSGSASGTTDTYTANLQTYTTGGVGGSDTVTLVEGRMIHGEDITTGTKLLAFKAAANPVGSQSANITAGADAGAVNAYPTNWRHYFDAPIYSPTVTLGTSPQLSVIRPETASRVASVGYMALVVEYAPPAETNTPQGSFETGTIASTDSSAPAVTAASTETGPAAGADADTLTATASSSETGALTATEASLLASTAASTETGTIAGSEASAPAQQQPSAETGTIAATEASATVLTVASAESGAITGTDVSTGAGSGTSTDSGTVTGANASTMAATSASAETGTIVATDAASLAAVASASDSGTVSSTDQSTTDQTSNQQDANSSETGAMAATEASGIVAAAASAETGAIAATHTSAILGTVTGSESGTITGSEASDTSGGQQAVGSAETGTMALAETSALVVSVSSTETPAIVGSEAADLVAAVSGSDVASMAVTHGSTTATVSGSAATQVIHMGQPEIAPVVRSGLVLIVPVVAVVDPVMQPVLRAGSPEIEPYLLGAEPDLAVVVLSDTPLIEA